MVCELGAAFRTTRARLLLSWGDKQENGIAFVFALIRLVAVHLTRAPRLSTLRELSSDVAFQWKQLTMRFMVFVMALSILYAINYIFINDLC